MSTSKRPKLPNTPLAEAKVQEALALIEHAQHTLDIACQRLCPVRGVSKEWEKLGKLSDSCKAMWHHLNELIGEGAANGLSVDYEDGPKIKAPLAVPGKPDVNEGPL